MRADTAPPVRSVVTCQSRPRRDGGRPSPCAPAGPPVRSDPTATDAGTSWWGTVAAGTVDPVQGIGMIDEAGRLRLIGAGAAGAAFGVVLVVLVLSSWTPATTTVLVVAGIPAGAAGAAIGVVTTLRSWRAAGGYERSVAAQRWVADNRVPADVPAEVWIPMLQAQADREGAGWGKVVLGTLWIAMTWSMRDQHGPLVTTLLIGLWIGMALWGGVVVVPRARAARTLLRERVAALS